MAKISIIVPIYKVGEFIKRCVDSVLSQTYKDWELILVDDGSPDESGAICDEYAKSDSRIKVFHKENGGLSDARNYGLTHATGDYVYYLDGDDWIRPETIQLLLQTSLEYQADFVQGGFYYAYPTYLLTQRSSADVYTYISEQALQELLSNRKIKNFAWGNLIQRELASQVTFRKGKFFEDIYWKYLILDKAQNIVLISKPLYYYRQRHEDISGNFSVRNLDLLKGMDERLQFLASKYPQLSVTALNQYWLTSFQFMQAAMKDPALRNLYKDYFDQLENRYHDQFVVSRKKSLYIRTLYLLYHKCRKGYLFFRLVERIWNRIKKNDYERIFINNHSSCI